MNGSVIVLLVALTGWVVGIAINIFADNYGRGKIDGARCQRCGQRLPAWSRSVLLGTLTGHDHCPACGHTLHGRKTVVEILTPLLFLWVLKVEPSLYIALYKGALLALFLCLAVIDLEHMRVPNAILGGVLGLAVLGIAAGILPSWKSALLGGLSNGVAFTLLAVVQKGALGGGDVKLATVEGVLLGFPAGLIALLYGVILGGVAALAFLLTKQLTRKDAFAYAPYLIIPAAFFLLY